MADFTYQIIKAGNQGYTRYVSKNRRAALRISIIDDVPANSCTVGNMFSDDFREKLMREGFSFKALPYVDAEERRLTS